MARIRRIVFNGVHQPHQSASDALHSHDRGERAGNCKVCRQIVRAEMRDRPEKSGLYCFSIPGSVLLYVNRPTLAACSSSTRLLAL